MTGEGTPRDNTAKVDERGYMTMRTNRGGLAREKEVSWAAMEGQEVLWSYGPGYWRQWGSEEMSKEMERRQQRRRDREEERERGQREKRRREEGEQARREEGGREAREARAAARRTCCGRRATRAGRNSRQASSTDGALWESAALAPQGRSRPGPCRLRA